MYKFWVDGLGIYYDHKSLENHIPGKKYACSNFLHYIFVLRETLIFEDTILLEGHGMQSYSLLNAATIFLGAFMIVTIKKELASSTDLSAWYTDDWKSSPIRKNDIQQCKKSFCNKKLMTTIILLQKRLILRTKDDSLTIYRKLSYFLNRYHITLDSRYLKMI